jgi:hypothetical protein
MHPTGKGIAEIVKRIMPKVVELIARAVPQAATAPKT